MKSIATIIFTVLLTTLIAKPTQAIQRGHLAAGLKYKAVIGIENCTAVVIHPRVLLTAAHCAPMLFQGSNKYYPDSRGQSEIMDIKEIVIHEGFEEKEGPNHNLKINDDIALIILSHSLNDKEILSAIPQLSQNINPVGEKFQAVGLGFYRKGMHSFLGDSDNSLKRLLNYKVAKIQSSVLFISSTEKSAGICGGDSGGALFIQNSVGGYELAGVLTAISHYCGNNDEVSYAESVAQQRFWINKKLALEKIAL